MRVGIDARLAHETGIGRYVRGLTNALIEHERDLELVVIANPAGNDPTAVWDWPRTTTGWPSGSTAAARQSTRWSIPTIRAVTS